MTSNDFSAAERDKHIVHSTAELASTLILEKNELHVLLLMGKVSRWGPAFSQRTVEASHRQSVTINSFISRCISRGARGGPEQFPVQAQHANNLNDLKQGDTIAFHVISYYPP